MPDVKFRTERDSIGPKEVPAHVYYGVQTQRAVENFNITGLAMHKEIIFSIVEIKKAAAIVNEGLGLISKEVKDAICTACDDILAGHLLEQFVVDPIQGGAGTSFNMNANEVIANRAGELLGDEKGAYKLVNPNDHVNFGQSTNDVVPTSGRMATIKLLDKATVQLQRLHGALLQKAAEFDGVIKMGRTQMQDAVPIRLGQEYKAYSAGIARDIARFALARNELCSVNLGGTAIGTGINADEKYLDEIVPELAKICGLPLVQTEDLIDGTQNLEGYVFVSGILKSCAVNLSKMSNDLRLTSSGPRTGFGEIKLPQMQPGSSIMPGKVNPVIPEVVNQVAFNIIGNDVTITMAAEAGQLELNAFEPILFYKLFQSIETLTNAVDTFIDHCVLGIVANEAHCKNQVENSVGIITALTPHLGYKKSADVAKEAIETGAPVRDLLLRDKLLSEADLNIILNVFNMTTPGISGKELLK